MSEPDSLYFRVFMRPEQRDAFLASRIPPMDRWQDWHGWLENSQFYGSLSDRDILSLSYKGESVRAYLDGWLNEGSEPWEQTGSAELWNPQTGEWIFAIQLFAENYLEYIRFLHVLRGAGAYLEPVADPGFILIYSYYWDNPDSNTCVEFGGGSSRIVRDIAVARTDEAFRYFSDLDGEAGSDG